MFIDASVIVAIIAEEEGYEGFQSRLVDTSDPVYVSAIARFEAVHAIARIASTPLRPTAKQLADAGQVVDHMLGGMDVNYVDLAEHIGRLALAASATYGKAIGHPADLNMGDCFAYACAKSLNVPLLYKGEDLAKTDLA